MNNTGIGKLRTNVRDIISQRVEKIKNGCITIVIQDGYVIQIDSSEKIKPEQYLCRS